ATLFYRSLHPVEQAHVAAAFSFEIGKCYEQTIKERALAVLANIDAGLCATVAAALGLEAPRPSVPPVDPETLSPALSQLGSTWPIEGRRVGILTGPTPTSPRWRRWSKRCSPPIWSGTSPPSTAGNWATGR